MLTPATKKCYEFARTNDDFHKALITDSMKNRKPNIFSDDVDRALYASVYYGWLIAKAGDGHKGAEAQLIILKELRSE